MLMQNLSNKELSDMYKKAIADRESICKEKDDEIRNINARHQESKILIDVSIDKLSTEINSRVNKSTMTIEEASIVYGEI